MNGTTHRTTKGYLRITAGPCKWQYVHRVVAEAMIGRSLVEGEEVHHKNGDPTDPKYENLFVLGKLDHAWISRKTKDFLLYPDVPQELEFERFLNSFYEVQRYELIDRGESRFESPIDGIIMQAWESQHAS